MNLSQGLPFLGFSFVSRRGVQLEEGKGPSTTTGFRAFSAETRASRANGDGLSTTTPAPTNSAQKEALLRMLPE